MKLLMENWRKFLNEENEPSANMPQLLDTEYTKFVQYLGTNIQDPKTRALIGAGLSASDGDPSDDVFGFQEGPIAVAKLIPTQNEIDINKSLAYPLVKDPSEFVSKASSNGPFTVVEPIVTFNGRYVVDGHHRWSTVYACNKNASIDAINITMEGIDPLDVLKAVQMAIGLQAKKIPIQSVEGTNLLKIDQNGLAGWITKNVPAATYEAIVADSKVKKLITNYAKIQEVTEITSMGLALVKTGLINYIWSNVASMRKTSQPVKGAGPRDFMPQTGGVNWKEPLAKGQVDIKPPHGNLAKKAAE